VAGVTFFWKSFVIRSYAGARENIWNAKVPAMSATPTTTSVTVPMRRCMASVLSSALYREWSRSGEDGIHSH
jgi:hypothetical protein